MLAHEDHPLSPALERRGCSNKKKKKKKGKCDNIKINLEIIQICPYQLELDAYYANLVNEEGSKSVLLQSSRKT